MSFKIRCEISKPFGPRDTLRQIEVSFARNVNSGDVRRAGPIPIETR